MADNNNIGRRDFLTKSAKIGAVTLVGGSLISCNSSKKLVPLKEAGTYYIPELPDKADDGRELKVGLIGCGGRGTGALKNLLEAANGITVTALGDVFPDKIESCKASIKKSKGLDIDNVPSFVGFDAYKEVIDSGVDMVILTTPPVFRPMQFAYAVEKGVHSFIEKPICVDPKGYRTIMAAAAQARAKGLCVVTGTQRHHRRAYVESYKKIQEGWIGKIVSGNVYWNQGMLWYRNREAGWSDMEWNIRDWVNWKWLSGDHIVEQHVHNIDVFLWMSGLKPESCVATGARHRRLTGDQFDEFNVDYTFPGGIHLQSMCRQVDGCANKVGEIIFGTKGYWESPGDIYDYEGNLLWHFDKEAEAAEHPQVDPYTLEHVDWVNHIRRAECHVEAEETADSCLAGIMGREAAYTGAEVTWDAMSASPMDYLPEKLELGPLDLGSFTVPNPGK